MNKSTTTDMPSTNHPARQIRSCLTRFGRTCLRGMVLSALALATVAQAGMDGPGGMRGDRQRDGEHRASPRDEARHAGSAERWQKHTFTDWAEAYAKWLTSIPHDVNPLTDKTGIHCGTHQDGPVWFLGAPLGTDPNFNTFDLTCTIPAGKAIFMPVAAYFNDYPCPDPAFKPAENQSFPDFMASYTAMVVDNYTSAEATLNGKPLQLRRIATQTFPFVGAVDLNQLDACITGSTQSALIDGHFVVIDPLPPGDHELRSRSTSNFFGITEGKYLLRVR